MTRPPVLLIHGDQDPVVPFESLAEAADALAAAGVEASTHVSRGMAHGIAPDGLGLALRFIQDRLRPGRARRVVKVSAGRVVDCRRSGKMALCRGLPEVPGEI